MVLTEEDKKDVQKENNERQDESRRNFLKALFAAGAVVTIGGLGSVGRYLTPQVKWANAWPVLKLVPLSSINQVNINNPTTFNYPLVNQPNYLLKLGVKAKLGIGPDGDIVGFSQICQHLGCYWKPYPGGGHPICSAAGNYTYPTPFGFCCCHGSHYDLTNGGALLENDFQTPAPLPLPQVLLDVDSSGNIIVKGMTPPNIYGFGPTPRLPASANPKDIPNVTQAELLEYDTFNGTLVDESTINVQPG